MMKKTAMQNLIVQLQVRVTILVSASQQTVNLRIQMDADDNLVVLFSIGYVKNVIRPVCVRQINRPDFKSDNCPVMVDNFRKTHALKHTVVGHKISRPIKSFLSREARNFAEIKLRRIGGEQDVIIFAVKKRDAAEMLRLGAAVKNKPEKSLHLIGLCKLRGEPLCG